MTCSELLWAIEVKPTKKFSSQADIDRALREGVLQLIGMNAGDNHHTSPSVIVTAFMSLRYIFYLERDRVKKTASFAAAIAFVQERSKLHGISGNIASPSIPSFSSRYS